MEKNTLHDVDLALDFQKKFAEVESEVHKIIVGQDDTIRMVLIAIFCNGHSLLVGVPGLAKTLLVHTISSVLDLKFSRIQFTPDLMPSDILGSEIMDANRNLRFVKGPIFANIILADEINRTPPKTQAALLESMQEKSVTVAGNTYKLEAPFFVLATQNPIEQEGTYPLPEAQLDRFMFNLILDYPSYEHEVEVVKRTTTHLTVDVEHVLNAESILQYQELIRKVPVSDYLIEYAVKLVNKTRPGNPYATKETNNYIEWGAGPRASQYIILASKCHALIRGKFTPEIEDVKTVALPVLRHRIVRNFKAEAEGLLTDDIIKTLL
jgi:MoxR-like ATPase